MILCVSEISEETLGKCSRKMDFTFSFLRESFEPVGRLRQRATSPSADCSPYGSAVSAPPSQLRRAPEPYCIVGQSWAGRRIGQAEGQALNATDPQVAPQRRIHGQLPADLLHSELAPRLAQYA